MSIFVKRGICERKEIFFSCNYRYKIKKKI